MRLTIKSTTVVTVLKNVLVVFLALMATLMLMAGALSSVKGGGLKGLGLGAVCVALAVVIELTGKKLVNRIKQKKEK